MTSVIKQKANVNSILSWSIWFLS